MKYALCGTDFVKRERQNDITLISKELNVHSIVTEQFAFRRHSTQHIHYTNTIFESIFRSSGYVRFRLSEHMHRQLTFLNTAIKYENKSEQLYIERAH